MAPAVVVPRKGEFSQWLTNEGVSHIVDPMPWPNSLHPRPIWHLMRVAAWARTRGINILHSNEHDCYPFAAILRRILRIPIVCHIRYLIDPGFAQWCFTGDKKPNALFWTSERQRIDSEAAAQKFRGIVPEFIVRLGASVRHYDNALQSGTTLRTQLGIHSTEVVIGTASPLRPRKRVLDFIEMSRQLLGRHRNVVALIAGGEIVGDEDYYQAVSSAVRASGMEDRLRLLGNVCPIEPFHHACDISVSTSEYETFGNSVCEAMACAKPVVAYDGGSVSEVLGDAGIVVPVGEVAAMTDSVEKLVMNVGERSKLGALARQRVADKFDPQVSFDIVKEVYSKLLKREPLATVECNDCSVQQPEPQV